MSRLTQSIQKLSALATLAEHELDMQVALHKASDLDTRYQSSFTRSISDTLPKVIQELLELQQVQDLALATQQGEV